MTPFASSNRPLVSVVITAYNHERYIAESVNAALAQRYPHKEIVVVDDGSTDGTLNVLMTFGDRIRVIAQANTGVAGSRNRGIVESKGQLIAFMDGDDRWEPEKLDRQVEAALRFPNAGLIACDGYHWDGTNRTGTLFPSRLPGVQSEEPIVESRVFEPLVNGNFVSTTTQVMVPRAVLDLVGLSDPSFPIGNDYDLYLRIASRYSFAFVRVKLVDWRYTPTSASGPASLRQFRWTLDMVAVLRKHAKAGTPESPLCAATARRRSRECARLAYYRGTDGERLWAIGFLRQLWVVSGFDPVIAVYLGGIAAPRWLRSVVARTKAQQLPSGSPPIDR